MENESIFMSENHSEKGVLTQKKAIQRHDG